MYANSFDSIAHQFALCREHGLGPSIAIYEPGFLRVVLAYLEAGQLPGRLLRRSSTSAPTAGLAGAPFGLPPTPRALDAYLELLDGTGLGVGGVGGRRRPHVARRLPRRARRRRPPARRARVLRRRPHSRRTSSSSSRRQGRRRRRPPGRHLRRGRRDPRPPPPHRCPPSECLRASECFAQGSPHEHSDARTLGWVLSDSHSRIACGHGHGADRRHGRSCTTPSRARLRSADQRYTSGRRRLVELLAEAPRPETIPELLAAGAVARPELGLPQPRRARGVRRRPPRRDERRALALRARRGPHGPPPPPDLHVVRPGRRLHGLAADGAQPRSRPRARRRRAPGSAPRRTASTCIGTCASCA